MKKLFDYYIDASNVAGLGSINVVSSLLRSLSSKHLLGNSNVYLLIPNIEYWNEFKNELSPKWVIRTKFRSKIKVLRFIYKAMDLLLFSKFIPHTKMVIVLGDFPIRTKVHQVVLLHNPHLVDKEKKDSSFNFHRFIFKFNVKYVSSFIVQTELMRGKLINIVPNFPSKIHTILMPVNEKFKNKINFSVGERKSVILFYPASFYKHKNHKIIFYLFQNFRQYLSDVIFVLTISKSQFSSLHNNPDFNYSNIVFLGPVGQDEVLYNYLNSDALFFPSLDETLGLPLIEAMSLGKDIICSDLPYSRAILKDNQALFFDTDYPNTFLKSLGSLREHIKNNEKPDWTDLLMTLPENWDEYAKTFLSKLEAC